MSELVDDSSGRLDEDQANKIPKTNRKETTITRGDPLCSDNSDIPEWLQEFRGNSVDDEIPEHGDSHASSSHEPSLEPTPARSADLGKHSVETHFSKERNCGICQRTKITRAPCRRRMGGVVPRAENFGDLITADHKILSEEGESRNNHRYAVVVHDLAIQWIQSYPCRTKTSQETQRSLQKFLEPNRKPKVIYTDNSLEFGKACEDLSWNHCTSTPHRSETNGIAERAVRRVKAGTSAVLLQSCLATNGRRILWNATAICETSQTYYLMGRLHTKDVLENILKDQSFRLVHWLCITLFLRKTSQESIKFERKSYLDCSLDALCTRVEFGRVTQWLQTLRTWKRWTHPKSTPKDSMRKRWHFPKKMEIPIFQSQIRRLTDARKWYCCKSLALNDKSEIFRISTIEWNTIPWMRTNLLHDRAIKLSKAKVHVYYDSVLFLGKIHEHPWRSWIEWDRRRASRARVEYFPRTHNTGTAPWDSKEDGRTRNNTWSIQRSDHLHVDVQWHRLDERRKLQKVFRI